MALLRLFSCGGSGQNLGFSGGDPPNPPYYRRGRTAHVLGHTAHVLGRTAHVLVRTAHVRSLGRTAHVRSLGRTAHVLARPHRT
jgi:hypothetical protein